MDIILYIETVHKDCHKEHGAVESVTDDEAHDTTQREETPVLATRFGVWRWPGWRALPSISIEQGLIEQRCNK